MSDPSSLGTALGSGPGARFPIHGDPWRFSQVSPVGFSQGFHVNPNILLVGGIPIPLKNMNSSVGMMTFPTEWKVIKFHGSSHHQADHHHIPIVVGL